MADTYKKLAQGQAAASAGSIYTVPGDAQAIIKHIRIVNNDSSARNIKLWHDGTTAPYVILPSTPIRAGGWAEFDGTLTLDPGDVINAQGSVGSQITITIYGMEIT